MTSILYRYVHAHAHPFLHTSWLPISLPEPAKSVPIPTLFQWNAIPSSSWPLKSYLFCIRFSLRNIWVYSTILPKTVTVERIELHWTVRKSLIYQNFELIARACDAARMMCSRARSAGVVSEVHVSQPQRYLSLRVQLGLFRSIRLFHCAASGEIY